MLCQEKKFKILKLSSPERFFHIEQSVRLVDSSLKVVAVLYCVLGYAHAYVELIGLAA